MALVPALILAVCDWIAVATGKKKLEYVFKPLTLVSLIVVVYLAGADQMFSGGVDHFIPEHTWRFVLGALVFSLIGDIFLMLPTDRFVQGLTAFLIAHVCYVVAFIYSFRESGTYAVGGVVAVVSILMFQRVGRGIRERGKNELLVPVSVYVVAISAMVVAVIGTLFVDPFMRFDGAGAGLAASEYSRFPHDVAAAVGAVLFYVSDAMIGWSRFVQDFKNSRLAIMVTYHLGQMGFVLYLLRS